MLLAEAINVLLPGAQHRGCIDAGTEAQYNALEWCDSRTKPTWAAIEAKTLLPSPKASVLTLESLLARIEALEAQ